MELQDRTVLELAIMIRDSKLVGAILDDDMYGEKLAHSQFVRDLSRPLSELINEIERK